MSHSTVRDTIHKHEFVSSGRQRFAAASKELHHHADMKTSASDRRDVVVAALGSERATQVP
jgi:hypothetical protein